jgi:hypothetical protein
MFDIDEFKSVNDRWASTGPSAAIGGRPRRCVMRSAATAATNSGDLPDTALAGAESGGGITFPHSGAAGTGASPTVSIGG